MARFGSLTQPSPRLSGPAIVVLVGLVLAALLVAGRAGPAAAARPHPAPTPRPRATTTPPPQPTATLRLFAGPDSGAQAFLRGIGEARTRLLLSAGVLSDARVISALLHARARGVDVRVLYGPSAISAATLDRLGAAGVLLRTSSPDFTALSQASLVVDTRYMLLSTSMLTPFALEGTRVFVVRDRDALAVAQAAALFYDDWLRRPPSLFVSHLVVGPVQQGAAVAHVIDLAASTLDIYTQRLDDPSVAAALLRAAQRGVRVRLLTSMDAGWGADITLVVAGLPVRRLGVPAVRGTVMLEDGQRAYLTSLALTTFDSSARGVGVLLRASSIVRVLRQTFADDWARGVVVQKPAPPPRPRPRPCKATARHPCPTLTPEPTATPAPSTPTAPAAPATGTGTRRTVTAPVLAGVRLRPSATLFDPVARGAVQQLTVAAPAGSRVAITLTYPAGATTTLASEGVTGRDGRFVTRWTIPRTGRPGDATVALVVRDGTGWRSFNAAFTIR